MGDTVRFEQEADTLLRDIPFLVRGERLEVEFATGGDRLQVILRKSSPAGPASR